MTDSNAHTVTAETPVGLLTITASPAGVREITFGHRPTIKGSPAAERISAEALSQLERYFAGELSEFDLPLDLEEVTPFQRSVLKQLNAVPWGETRSYGELAAAVGRPKAARAIGGALNRNPIAVVLPCHRVVGSNGSLTGFAGGTERKRWLLSHETATVSAPCAVA